MNIKLAQNEQFVFTTASGGNVLVPDSSSSSNRTLATIDDITLALHDLAVNGITVDGVKYKLVEDVQVTDLPTLAQAAGVTPTDSTTAGDIQTALNLADTNTVQDAIDAVS